MGQAGAGNLDGQVLKALLLGGGDTDLAVLNTLQLDADRLPTPRADGDREALRVLLTAREAWSRWAATALRRASGAPVGRAISAS